MPANRRADDVDTKVLQPLTLRANQGDIIEIEFHNDLDRPASIHQTALPYDVETSDGMDVGFNPDTTVDPGESITYRWSAEHLGTHFFLDGANQAVDSANEPPQEANLLSRGLFGSVSIFPQGTTWTDPYTGEERQGRVQADIHVPEDVPEAAIERGFVPGVSFRQVQLYYHTPEGVVTADGEQLTWPNSDEPQTVHAINYRADPTGNRIPAIESDDPELANLEGAFYSSWIHGDPGGGDNVYPMYTGDPVKFSAIGASLEENHVHHLHNHRWKEIPAIQESDTIDSQTIGLGAVYEVPLVPAFGGSTAAIDDFESVRPEMTFDDAFQVGAGGAHGSTGDMLFHCHLFPHYAEGMWGMLRVLDKEQDELVQLPDNDPPIPADSDVPGFPDFIPGEFGEVPPFPPYGAAGLDGFRNPTPEEEQALGDDILPGAPYTDPCNPDIDVPGFEGPDLAIEGIVREYDIVALPADIVYNDDGHHDPEGLVFALEGYREIDPDTGKVTLEEPIEDAELIRKGKLNPEPLVIRANVGDCVQVNLRNETEGGKGNHIHFVSYDVLGSDGFPNGFNYRQEARPGDERAIPYRWLADEEGTIFFHDHITGVDDVMNGTFCALVVEPPESEWLDPHTGNPIRSGTQAIIENPNGDDFREFALAYHDFAQLVERGVDKAPDDPENDAFINPEEEHNENAGVMAINYRNTPYYIRDDEDPAYVHSSFVHGDPSTPLLEAYEDDPVRIRLWQGAYEEQHALHVNGRHIEPEGLSPEESVSQVVGTSEAFTFDILPEDHADGTEGHQREHREKEKHGHERFVGEPLTENPAGLPIKDYLYGSPVVDDLWDGMWGIHRVFGAEVDHLHPLPDQSAPEGKISKKELVKMGHPAPFSDFDWSEIGHKAKLLYADDDDRRFPPDKDARQNPSIDGNPPPQPPSPGDPCPADAPVREFDVSALQTPIEYNDYGDHDPFGTVFALDKHAKKIQKGKRKPTPLSLWVNEGDCIQINLTNRLDPDELDNDHPHPQMRTPRGDEEWERSERVSLHSTHTEYNVLGSDGTAVGFNWDQTIGLGETITYRWLVDDPTVGIVLWDYADVRSTRHHGAYGQMLVHPPGSEFIDPFTGEPLTQGISTQAIVKTPGEPDMRGFAMAFADGQHIINRDDPDDCVVPPGPDTENPDAPCPQIGDREDQGFLGINYRSEPFIRRFERASDEQRRVYDSDTHGDPNTPLFEAFLGDHVHFHVNQVADKARGLSFHLSDHQWNRFRNIDVSKEIGVDDRFIVAKSGEVVPFGGAGGLAESTGDFLYQETKQRRRLESGAWGIFRVHDQPKKGVLKKESAKPTKKKKKGAQRRRKHGRRHLHPLPDRARELQLRPEDRPGWTVARGDATGDGTQDLLIGVPDSDAADIGAGAAYLFYGSVDNREITDLLDADAQILGHFGDRAGVNVEITDGLVSIDTDADNRYVFFGQKEPTGTLTLNDADRKIDLDI
ncbi:multicopper oxidase domain-containing protein [Natronococcus wangiae]|uniref:multicopper oxidase domain-containing protein n=1 Tax=Natronococcus wangiae TaxID=3068275 RepID=UPI00273EE179|nr:multicopper oxidase domain-containing protein [Natronococcus sp. AD5]